MIVTAGINRDLAEVDALAMRLRDLASDFLSQDKIFGFEIAVSEALTNAVKHTPKTATPASFDVAMAKRCNMLVVAIYDPPGTPEYRPDGPAAALDQIETLATQGRGLALMQACADGVRFRVRKGRNQLILAFQTNGAAAPQKKLMNQR